jgi:hypothetical protein
MLIRNLMLISSVCSLLAALLHVYVIVKGPWAYRFFGAGETLATMAERGSWLPGLLTAGITVVFLVFAAYFAAGAGVVPSLPYMRVALIGIAAVYTLRGALLLPVWLSGTRISAFDFWSSLVSLGIGLLHCAAVALWLRACETTRSA